jgi:hypothetical protein
LRTNWTAASRTSSEVAGGARLWRRLMLRHMVGRAYRLSNVGANRRIIASPDEAGAQSDNCRTEVPARMASLDDNLCQVLYGSGRDRAAMSREL